MTNRRRRVDLALEQAKELLQAKQKRDNPHFAAFWWAEAEERRESALSRLNALDGWDKESVQAANAFLQFEWDALHWLANNKTLRSAYPSYQMGFFAVFPDWIALVPAELREAAIRLMTRGDNPQLDRRGDVLSSWLRALAFARVKTPAGATQETFGVIVRGIIDHDASKLNSSVGWCVGCHLFCPLTDRFVELLPGPCRHCGYDADPRERTKPWPAFIHHPQGHAPMCIHN